MLGRTIALGLGTLFVSALSTTSLPVSAQSKLTPQQKEALLEEKERYEEQLKSKGGWKWLGVSTCTQVNQGELTPKAGVSRMIFAAMTHPPTKEEEKIITETVRKTCTIQSYKAMYSILNKAREASSEESLTPEQ